MALDTQTHRQTHVRGQYTLRLAMTNAKRNKQRGVSQSPVARADSSYLALSVIDGFARCVGGTYDVSAPAQLVGYRVTQRVAEDQLAKSPPTYTAKCCRYRLH